MEEALSKYEKVAEEGKRLSCNAFHQLSCFLSESVFDGNIEGQKETLRYIEEVVEDFKHWLVLDGRLQERRGEDI